MSQIKNPIASIIIVNYDNAKYLKRSLNSAIKQSFKNKEIIVVDDISNDNSLEILEKYRKKIKLYITKKKTHFGSYNQMNCYYEGFKRSKGKYIFFLDSDDYFKLNKVEKVVNIFKKQFSNIVFDLPVIKKKNKLKYNKFVQKNFFFSHIPRFTPQSCISVEKYFAKNFFKVLKIEKYPSIWLDFRVAMFSFLKFGNIFILEDYLTYYRQLDNSASKKYKIFSKIWWQRRKEAHEFFSFMAKKLKIKNKISLDTIITYLVNLFY